MCIRDSHYTCGSSSSFYYGRRVSVIGRGSLFFIAPQCISGDSVLSGGGGGVSGRVCQCCYILCWNNTDAELLSALLRDGAGHRRGLAILEYVLGREEISFWHVQALSAMMMLLAGAIPNVAGMGPAEFAFLRCV